MTRLMFEYILNLCKSIAIFKMNRVSKSITLLYIEVEVPYYSIDRHFVTGDIGSIPIWGRNIKYWVDISTIVLFDPTVARPNIG